MRRDCEPIGYQVTYGSEIVSKVLPRVEAVAVARDLNQAANSDVFKAQSVYDIRDTIDEVTTVEPSYEALMGL